MRLLIGIGIAGAVVLGYVIKKKMSDSKKMSDPNQPQSPICQREEHTCDLCGIVVSEECLVQVYSKYCCPSCRQYHPNNVEVYPESYKGSKFMPCNYKETISSNWHSNKDFATGELKMMAAQKGCDLIYSVTYKEDLRMHGNYYYTIWKAVGRAAEKVRT